MVHLCVPPLPPSSPPLQQRSAASDWLKGVLRGQARGGDVGEAGAACLPGFRRRLGRRRPSVVSNGGQFGVQVHTDVFVEAAEGNDGAVPKIVEAVQVLPLFGIPQQFIPAQVTQFSHFQGGLSILKVTELRL